MIAREVRGEISENGPDANHPVIRTLYDHLDEVTVVTFHPREQILVSGSTDKTVKLFDFSKTAVKRAMKTLSEVFPVRALSFHPGGEFLLVTTDHPTIRLYNVETAQCFVCSAPGDQHKDVVMDVNYSDNARLYVTGSKDGDVKVWDGISNRCVETFSRAHDGHTAATRVFVHSPTVPAFLTGSDDFRARKESHMEKGFSDGLTLKFCRIPALLLMQDQYTFLHWLD
ncbi:WD domain, G-beta repeat protein [Teladorsagia circumcincta]|uniref:Cleavage stimulation factor 50 kDa subunit n=1 Tax=Teladorsagia circumcincta TaxID=45464 RepID=A0A2G9UQD8_TELCI|nr:WD domain, G-beta repeat protein [Teladorsagia circumcincta]